jgi:hypothetical protein
MDLQKIKEGFERFKAAFIGEPDVVPVSAQTHDHTFYILGLNAKDFFTNPLVFIKAQIVIREYYDLDLIPSTYDCYNIEAETLGQKLLYTDTTMPDADTEDILIKEKSYLERLKAPIAGVSGRMPYVLDIYRLSRKYMGLPPLPIFCAPFSLAVMIRGYINLIKDIRKDPPFAHQLFIFLVDEVLIPWVKALKEAVPETPYILGADAWAAPPNIDLKIQEEFIVPYALRLQEAIPEAFVMQGWGASYFQEPEKFMETLIRMKIPYIYGMDPDPARLGCLFYKEFANKHNLTLSLGIQDLLLRDGPIEAIVDKIRSYIKTGAPGGRFNIFLNYIPADTPPAHVKAAIAAIKQFGEYPLKEIDKIPFHMPEVEPISEFLKRMGIRDKDYFYTTLPIGE